MRDTLPTGIIHDKGQLLNTLYHKKFVKKKKQLKKKTQKVKKQNKRLTDEIKTSRRFVYNNQNVFSVYRFRNAVERELMVNLMMTLRDALFMRTGFHFFNDRNQQTANSILLEANCFPCGSSSRVIQIFMFIFNFFILLFAIYQRNCKMECCYSISTYIYSVYSIQHLIIGDLFIISRLRLKRTGTWTTLIYGKEPIH